MHVVQLLTDAHRTVFMSPIIYMVLNVFDFRFHYPIAFIRLIKKMNSRLYSGSHRVLCYVCFAQTECMLFILRPYDQKEVVVFDNVSHLFCFGQQEE